MRHISDRLCERIEWAPGTMLPPIKSAKPPKSKPREVVGGLTSATRLKMSCRSRAISAASAAWCSRLLIGLMVLEHRVAGAEPLPERGTWSASSSLAAGLPVLWLPHDELERLDSNGPLSGFNGVTDDAATSSSDTGGGNRCRGAMIGCTSRLYRAGGKDGGCRSELQCRPAVRRERRRLSRDDDASTISRDM
jgi:hypothetical protein